MLLHTCAKREEDSMIRLPECFQVVTSGASLDDGLLWRPGTKDHSGKILQEKIPGLS